MTATDKLNERARERDAHLATIVAILQSDKRVVAAWLGGSLGRGAADQLSDIDLYVVVSEAYARFVMNSTLEFVSRVSGLILTEQAPANAPANGAYLLTMYHGATGPHQVDWYWVTDKIKEIPVNSVVLFNLADIPPASMQLPLLSDFDLENEIACFWALAGIAAKKIARQHLWSAITILSNLNRSLDRVTWFLCDKSAPGHTDTRSHPPPTSAPAQLAELRKLIEEFEALSQLVDAAGQPALDKMSSELAPLLQLAEAIITEPA